MTRDDLEWTHHAGKTTHILWCRSQWLARIDAGRLTSASILILEIFGDKTVVPTMSIEFPSETPLSEVQKVAEMLVLFGDC